MLGILLAAATLMFVTPDAPHWLPERHESLVLFNPKTSSTIQKRPFHSENLNSETPGDSKSAFRH